MINVRGQGFVCVCVCVYLGGGGVTLICLFGCCVLTNSHSLSLYSPFWPRDLVAPAALCFEARALAAGETWRRNYALCPIQCVTYSLFFFKSRALRLTFTHPHNKVTWCSIKRPQQIQDPSSSRGRAEQRLASAAKKLVIESHFWTSTHRSWKKTSD